MTLTRIERLLKELGRRLPTDRLFSDKTAAQLRTQLEPTDARPAETDRPEDAVEPVSRATVATHSRGRQPLAWAAAALAAAVIFAALLITHSRIQPPTPILSVDGAYAKTDLFSTTRGEPAAVNGRFYIGVKVDRPAYVRILARDERGVFEALPLDGSGALETHVAQDKGTIFGGYDIASVDDKGRQSIIEAFIVLSGVQSINDEALAKWINVTNDRTSRGQRADSAQLERELGQLLHCAVRSIVP